MSAQHYERLYIFTVMWCIGSFLELDDRAKLEHFIRAGEEFTAHDLPKTRVDKEETMFEYYVNNEGQWAHWDTRVMT